MSESFKPQVLSESKPKSFLEFRKSSAKEINDEICEKFMSGSEINQEVLERIFGNDPETIKRVTYVLERFAKPKDADKARRKDGSHIATHSLQLFRTAKDFYNITNKDVGRAVLVHDLIEDTQTTREDIRTALSIEDSDLAHLMTEEELDEESRLKAGEDKGELSIAKFAHKLKSGGEPIVLAEILDRIDDISDLGYITQKFSKPENREKALATLEKKFAKCSFTVDALIDENSSEEVIKMKKAFYELMGEQKQKIEAEFGVVTKEESIEKFKSKFMAFYEEIAKSQENK